jgi:flagellar export protein FliJ
MNKASRLEPIADYAGMVENEAARRLAASAKALETKEREVEQLRSYLAEYRQRTEVEHASTDSLRWRNTRAFLSRLTEVVSGQEAELQKAVEKYRLEAERWRDSYRRSKSLDKVIEQAQREILQEGQRRDQAELDELVMQQQLRRR